MMKYFILGMLALLLTGCSKFSDEELLKHYSEMPSSDFKNVQTLYEGYEIVRVYFKFQMNGEGAYHKLENFLNKYFIKIDISKLSVPQRENYSAGHFKWWNPPLPSESCQLYRIGANAEKNITLGYVLIDKKTNIIYASFINATPQ